MALPVIIGAIARVGAAEGAAAAGAGEAAAGSGAARAVSQLGQLQGAVSQVGQASHQSSSMIAGLASKISTGLTHALTLWIGFVEKVAKPIEDLVRVANPAVADAFLRAVQDAYGVVGRLLIPVMDAFTRVARKVGDVMAGLEPVFQPAINAIAQLIDTMGEEFVRIVKEQAPVFELFAAVIVRVAEAASAAVRILGTAISGFNGIGRWVARQLGFGGQSADFGRSGMGAAARTARFVQPKQIADDAIRNSLMAQVGMQKKPEDHAKKTADSTDNIWKWIERNAGRLLGGKGEAAGTGSQAGDFAAGLADSIPAVRLARWALAQAQRG